VDNSNPDYHEADYSPGGDKEFTKGDEVIIKCTRGTISGSTKALLTGDLESLEYVDQAEDYQYKDVVILRGRCKGWQLFARKFNGDLRTLTGSGYQTYKRTNGEAESMIAYLIDNYTETPLSHSRVNSVATANANKDQKVVAVTDGSKFAAGDLVKIKDDSNWEYNKVASVSTNNVTMVSDLLENYTTADNLTLYLDLIRNSDTTYTKMLFTHETVFDIIKFITDTADTGGTIGYDSRIEYDGKYAWLPRGHVTESNFDLTAEVQLERFLDDATRIRNKITVFGKADKPYPLDADGQAYSDAYTETYSQSLVKVEVNVAAAQADVEVAEDASDAFSVGDYMWLTDSASIGEECQIKSIAKSGGSNDVITMESNIGAAYTTANYVIIWEVSSTQGWGYIPQGAYNSFNIGLDAVTYHTGAKSIKVDFNLVKNYIHIYFVLPQGSEVDMDTYPLLKAVIRFADTSDSVAPDYYQIKLYSGACGVNDYAVSAPIRVNKVDEWIDLLLTGGEDNAGNWTVGSGIDWTDIKIINFYVYYTAAAATYDIYIDRLHFSGKRWGGGTSHAVSDGFAEDATSQSTYGTKEHVVIGDMLLSDAECESKARSLLAFYKDARATYELESETLDWGDYPIYPGNKISVDLTPLGITGDKRADSIDIHLTSIDHKLTSTFTLDSTPPRKADYLYNLSKRIRQLERNYGGTSYAGIR